jgi:hypothetical protein
MEIQKLVVALSLLPPMLATLPGKRENDYLYLVL